uniref:Uncharacterized protein n=1 Tax=viral metagenome TaxID=1070528 RepID=A0A6C0DIC3_9ZZZZ
MSNIEFRMNFGVKTTENYFCEKCNFISCKEVIGIYIRPLENIKLEQITPI